MPEEKDRELKFEIGLLKQKINNLDRKFIDIKENFDSLHEDFLTLAKYLKLILKT